MRDKIYVDERIQNDADTDQDTNEGAPLDVTARPQRARVSADHRAFQPWNGGQGTRDIRYDAGVTNPSETDGDDSHPGTLAGSLGECGTDSTSLVGDMVSGNPDDDGTQDITVQGAGDLAAGEFELDADGSRWPRVKGL